MPLSGDSRRPDATLLAGWLFADLLLAIFVVFLGAQGGEPIAGAAVPPTTTSIVPTTTSPPVTAPPPTKPAGVETTPYLTVVETNSDLLLGAASPARDAELRRVAAVTAERLKADGFEGRRAGFVLTFGVHPTVGVGQRIADAYNDGLRANLPAVFATAALRNFDYRANSGIGSVRVEIYFLTS